MKLLQRYVLKQFLKSLLATLITLTLLFLVFDFFDRVDKFVQAEASILTTLSYFAYKTPIIISLMLPVAVLLATMLSIGILSKNSELTAMRAAGATIFWITTPVFISAFILSLASIALNETVVPYSTRRVGEIYNIDVRKKDARGGYSRSDIWWRHKDTFFTASMFDSRSNTLWDLSKFTLNDQFLIEKRIDSEYTVWVAPGLGWSMQAVSNYFFEQESMQMERRAQLPLPIAEEPSEFYNSDTDPNSMSFRELSSFIDKQREAGLSIGGYLADLYAKLSFPFITLIVVLVVLPFSLRPARSHSMAFSVIAGLTIGFSYYAVHSLSIAMGRAELWPPLAAAWVTNMLMGFVGVVLLLGAESPH